MGRSFNGMERSTSGREDIGFKNSTKGGSARSQRKLAFNFKEQALRNSLGSTRSFLPAMSNSATPNVSRPQTSSGGTRDEVRRKEFGLERPSSRERFDVHNAGVPLQIEAASSFLSRFMTDFKHNLDATRTSSSSRPLYSRGSTRQSLSRPVSRGNPQGGGGLRFSQHGQPISRPQTSPNMSFPRMSDPGPRIGPRGWDRIRAAHKTSNVFKLNLQERQEKNCSSSFEKRQDYTKRALTSLQEKTHVFLEGGKRVLYREILSLKMLFNEIDVDGSETVTKQEVANFRTSPKFNSSKESQSIYMVLRAINETITFEGLVRRTYPDFTPKDVAACVDAVKYCRVNAKPIVDINSIKQELKELKDFFHLYANKDGAVTVEKFRALLEVLNDENIKDEYRDIYEEIADPRTKRVHRKQLLLWWVNHFRKEPRQPVTWEAIRDEAQAFWDQNDDIFGPG